MYNAWIVFHIQRNERQPPKDGSRDTSQNVNYLYEWIDVCNIVVRNWDKNGQKDRWLDNTQVFFIGIVGGGVQLGPLGTAATNRPIVPAPRDYDDREIGGMIGRGNQSTRRKPAPVPLCPPQHHMLPGREPRAPVGSQRLTAWVTARPNKQVTYW
jgi:hypothetical protein